MKKKLLVASLLTASLISLSAQEIRDSTFVGIEVGSTSYDLKAENLTFIGRSASQSDNGGTINLKLGKHLGDVGRVYGIIGTVNAEDATITTYGAGYDYLVYNSSSFTPFLGANVGYQQIDIETTSMDLSGLTYGLKLGAQYALDKNFDLEVGYRRSFSSKDDTIAISDQFLKITIENTGVIYIGANYNF